MGRFTAIDPLASKYPGLSPYVYCANNPMKFVDPDGRAGVIAGELAYVAAGAIVAGIAATAWAMSSDIQASNPDFGNYVIGEMADVSLNMTITTLVAAEFANAFAEGRFKGQPVSVGYQEPKPYKTRKRDQGPSSKQPGPPNKQTPDQPEPVGPQKFNDDVGSPSGGDQPMVPINPNLGAPTGPTIGAAGAVSLPEDKPPADSK